MPTASVLLNRLTARARLKHLQVLVKVAELGSFSRAAEETGMTQPAVTHIVSELESMLGVSLFTRHARGVIATPFCDELVPAALRVVESLGLAMEGVVARLEHALDAVRLGATAACVSGFLGEALAAFNETHPQVVLHLTEARPEELALLARRGEVDVVGCRRPAVLAEGWRFVPLQADRLVVACSTAHPLTARRRLTFAQLARQTWLAAPVSTVGRRRLDERLARDGIEPRFAWVSTIAVPATWALLQRRRLLTLIPYSVVRPLVNVGALAVLPLDEAFELEPLGVLLPSAPVKPALDRLEAFLVEHTR